MALTGTDMSDDRNPERLVFYEDDIKKISKTLRAFLKNAKANSVFLVDKEGHLITKEGHSSTEDPDTLHALVADSFKATRQLARLQGDEFFAFVPAREGEEKIQLSLVGNRTMLAVLFNNMTDIGLIRLHSSQVTAELTELFNEIARRGRKGPDAYSGTGPTPLPA